MNKSTASIAFAAIEDEKLFRVVAENVFASVNDGIIITDADGVIVYTNTSFTEITGYEQAEAIGRKPKMLRSEMHDGAFYDNLWSCLLINGHWHGDIWNRRKCGEAYLQHMKIHSVQSVAEEPKYYVAAFRDLTEIRRKDSHIKKLTQFDPLTALPNRFLLMDRLEQAIAIAARDHKKVGLLFIDLDRFKAINEGLGHTVGDEILQIIGQRIRRSVRAMDTVARSGGDEFMVVAGGLACAEDCAIVADTIAAALTADITVKGSPLCVGASIGIAVYPDDGQDAQDLMKSADAALYMAKSAGRGTFRFFQRNQGKPIDHLRLEMDLRAAVKNNELELFYQPQISLATGYLHGFEALLRWQHPGLGTISPTDFIPMAEEIGLIREIGLWVLRQVCRHIAHWRGQGYAMVPIAINVAAAQLHDERFLQALEAETRARDIPASFLHVELTESMLMQNPDYAAETLRRMQDTGVKVAVDDFGTGYSSLAYLRTLPIDVLKIDRSFISSIECEESTAKIVRMIIGLAKALGMTVIAEGVENQEQAGFLRSAGCHVAQGYLYARPLPVMEIERNWLAAARSDRVGGHVAAPAPVTVTEGAGPSAEGLSWQQTTCTVSA